MENLASIGGITRTFTQDLNQPTIVQQPLECEQSTEFNQRQCLVAWDTCAGLQRTNPGCHPDERSKARIRTLTEIFASITHVDLTLIEIFRNKNLDIDAKTFQQICALAETHCNATKVTISGVDVLLENYPSCMDALCLFISNNQRLTSVCFNTIPTIRFQKNLNQLVEAIRNNQSITELSFNNCEFDDIFDENRVCSLAQIEGLKTLNLENNSFTEENASELINQCAYSSLNFSGNYYPFGEIVVNRLEKNTSLIFFFAKWKNTTREGQCQKHLDRNFLKQHAKQYGVHHQICQLLPESNLREKTAPESKLILQILDFERELMIEPFRIRDMQNTV